MSDDEARRPLSAAERQARWRARHPDRVSRVVALREERDAAVGDALILARRVLEVRDAAALAVAQKVAGRVMAKWGGGK